jgi:hypothetical protein
VKELIPEFFYLPEFLLNSNNFDLGTKQSGSRLHNVTLPPWAKGSPHEFIRIQRQALESEYVSQHLHEWIDLIFGYKQRGKEAVEARNVFYYLTYEGAVNIDAIPDDALRKAMEAQIDNFGQTPSQLLRKPHPKRYPLDPLKQAIFLAPKQALKAYFIKISSSPILYIGIPITYLPSYLYLGVTDRIITVDRERIPASHRWLPTTANAQLSPFTFELDPFLSNHTPVGIPFAQHTNIYAGCFAVSNDGKMLLTCGHWDNSFKQSLIETSAQVQSIIKHKDIVTCLALTADGQILVTGSKDTTLMVWEVYLGKGHTYRIDENPIHILYGHNDEVTAIAVNAGLDVSVSGSKDGSCIIHTLRQGRYVRSIYHPQGATVDLVVLSPQGHIVFYSLEDNSLHLFTINGFLLCEGNANERLRHMLITSDSEFLVTGGEKGIVVVRQLHSFKVIHKFATNSPITSLAMTTEERHLIVGLADGKLLIIAVR